MTVDVSLPSLTSAVGPIFSIRHGRVGGTVPVVEADLLPHSHLSSFHILLPVAFPSHSHCLPSIRSAMALQSDSDKQVRLDFDPGSEKQTSSDYSNGNKYPVNGTYNDDKYPLDQPSHFDKKHGLEHHEGAHAGGYDPIIDQYSEAEIARIVRRVDIRLIPLCGLMYCVSLLDRTNLSNAAIAG